MQDDFQGPLWADHHARVSATIHKLVREVMAALVRLNAIQFYAPWQRDARCRECE